MYAIVFFKSGGCNYDDNDGSSKRFKKKKILYTFFSPVRQSSTFLKKEDAYSHLAVCVGEKCDISQSSKLGKWMNAAVWNIIYVYKYMAVELGSQRVCEDQREGFTFRCLHTFFLPTRCKMISLLQCMYSMLATPTCGYIYKVAAAFF